MIRVRLGPEEVAQALREVRIGAVIPAHDEEDHIEGVVAALPEFVDVVIIVDDGSRDGTAERVRAIGDPRVVLIQHGENRGLGAAVATGFREALRQHCRVVVKMDGDGQMDPRYLPRLLEPVLSGRADVAKGNRYAHLPELLQMPRARLIGNTALTFLVKLASGYWRSFDPTNGYIAFNSEVVTALEARPLARDFFFESGLLIELGILRAVVETVPIPARYGTEVSGLSITKTLFSFPPRLLKGLLRRIFWRYLVHDFSPVSIFLLLGIPCLALGVLLGTYVWWDMSRAGEYSEAGPVMLAALPVFIGFQMILQAIVLDVANVPTEPLAQTPWSRIAQSPPARRRGRRPRQDHAV